MRLVQTFLPRAVRDGADVEARTQMLVASAMGATAFQKGLGAMHAIAHSVGALYDAHHGLLNAVLMPYVLVANQRVLGDKMDRLSRYLALPHTGFDGVLEWVLALRQQVGIPHTLAEMGVDGGEAERVGVMAQQDAAAGGNPIAFSAEEYAALFQRAVTGELGS